MLADMLTFNLAFINAIGAFLRSEPMIYFVGLLMLLVVLRLILDIFRFAK